MRAFLVMATAAFVWALLAPPAAAAPRPRFVWPLAAPHPTVRRFEAPSQPFGPGHRGVDLGAPVNQQVLAAGDGVVVYAGQLADRPVVSVQHTGGLRTTYEPVTPAVSVGQRVARGEPVGQLRQGHAGCPGPCLHWGARRGAEYLDPLHLLAGRVRLLPWRDP
ncbi:MAG: M23 family metallopeptidase [Kutzneria sp.]|nr:M23 family metallopeptidase [Kutzneria sp.]